MFGFLRLYVKTAAIVIVSRAKKRTDAGRSY